MIERMLDQNPTSRLSAELALSHKFIKVHSALDDQEIIELHASNIALQSFGHEHVDTFRLVGSNSVLFSVPSLSTGYPATNPTTRLWNTDELKGTDQVLVNSGIIFNVFYLFIQKRIL